MNHTPTYIPLTCHSLTGARTPRPPQWNNAEAAQRQGLLAMVHIAKKDLRLTDDEYGAVLAGFHTESSGSLSIQQLERLIEYFKKAGWKPVHSLHKRHKGGDQARLDALRRRCVEIAKKIENGEKRLAGLALQICGVSDLTWCKDAAKLERVLAVLGKLAKADEHLRKE